MPPVAVLPVALVLMSSSPAPWRKSVPLPVMLPSMVNWSWLRDSAASRPSICRPPRNSTD